MPCNEVVFVDYMVISAHAGGTFAAATVTPSPVGACTFVDTVVGVEKEEGQDRLSVRVRALLAAAAASRRSATMGTIKRAWNLPKKGPACPGASSLNARTPSSPPRLVAFPLNLFLKLAAF